mmetsp:Transcript_46461/g.137270  ORF Transcript_46461/g.137270 Transcript_46461/m.137270 type:complete len:219 (-) Transcript_46461:1212-1868(-)
MGELDERAKKTRRPEPLPEKGVKDVRRHEQRPRDSRREPLSSSSSPSSSKSSSRPISSMSSTEPSSPAPGLTETSSEARCILPLMRMRPRSAFGVSLSIEAASETSSGISSIDPKHERINAAHFFCCSLQQCISIEMLSGRSVTPNAVSEMALSTSTSLHFVQSVWPCVTSGSPSSPSQQSISTERHPCAMRRRYMAGVDVDASWSPSRNELCEHETQ